MWNILNVDHMHRYRLPQVEHQGLLATSHLKKPYVNHIDFNTTQRNNTMVKYDYLWNIGIHLIVWNKLIIFFPHFTMSNGKRRFHRIRLLETRSNEYDFSFVAIYEKSKSQIIHYKLRRFTLKMYEFAHQVAIDMQIEYTASGIVLICSPSLRRFAIDMI